MTAQEEKFAPFIPTRGHQGLQDEAALQRQLDELCSLRFNLKRYLTETGEMRERVINIACFGLQILLLVASFTIFRGLPDPMRWTYGIVASINAYVIFRNYKRVKKQLDQDLARKLANVSFRLAIQQNENQNPGRSLSTDEAATKAKGLLYDRANITESLMDKIGAVFQEYITRNAETRLQEVITRSAEISKAALNQHLETAILEAGGNTDALKNEVKEMGLRDRMLWLARKEQDGLPPPAAEVAARKLFNQMRWIERGY